MRRFIHILLVLTLSAGLCSAEGARHHVSLDGGWEFRQKGDSLWMPAQVPGCVHTDLMANGVIEDPFYGRNEKSMQWIGEKDWEYRNVFYLDSGMVSLNNVWLVLEGVDTGILDPRDTYSCACEWEEKAKDLAARFIKNFNKYEGNDAGKALVAAGPKL